MSKKLLLIGGGRAHLSLLKKLKNETSMDCEITLLSPSSITFHADMLPGFVEEIYRLEDLEINLADLTEKAGIRFVQGTALSIDVKQRMVLTENGDILSFDVLSLDTDRRRKGAEILPGRENIFDLTERDHIERLKEYDHKKGPLVIVGDGAEAIEMSFSMKALKQTYHDHAKVILMQPPAMYREPRDFTLKSLEDELGNQGIEVYRIENMVEIHDNLIKTGNESVPFDTLLWMTVFKPPGVYKSSELPTDEVGRLLVEDTMQVKKYPFIFGAGNGVTIRNHPDLPVNGSIVDKQGEVLFENLKGYLETGEGYHFHPPKRWLSVISVGHKQAYLKYAAFSTKGKLAWKLKDKLDRGYVSSFR
ncbi:NAD(P)/FAD-dependent oxidoreductase [Bacillus sp. Marseille-Q3570]|uniref:NAD(P)/FAD-dependent oxidoreductase n=1 Tax=Bacillus sp. Marseille-Q3570 TaxID=2963522 RepID=UPI0021B779F6|nr:FAD-dependent oxidoreductase [Bacillus sp. Marseille-Q3570]